MPTHYIPVTVTSNEQSLHKPLTESLKLYDTRVVPKQNEDPFVRPPTGLLDDSGTDIASPSLSVADTEPHVTTAQLVPLLVVVDRSEGQDVMLGAGGADTSTLKLQLSELPLSSTPTHSTPVTPTPKS